MIAAAAASPLSGTVKQNEPPTSQRYRANQPVQIALRRPSQHHAGIFLINQPTSQICNDWDASLFAVARTVEFESRAWMHGEQSRTPTDVRAMPSRSLLSQPLPFPAVPLQPCRPTQRRSRCCSTYLHIAACLFAAAAANLSSPTSPSLVDGSSDPAAFSLLTPRAGSRRQVCVWALVPVCPGCCNTTRRYAQKRCDTACGFVSYEFGMLLVAGCRVSRCRVCLPC